MLARTDEPQLVHAEQRVAHHAGIVSEHDRVVLQPLEPQVPYDRAVLERDLPDIARALRRQRGVAGRMIVEHLRENFPAFGERVQRQSVHRIPHPPEGVTEGTGLIGAMLRLPHQP